MERTDNALGLLHGTVAVLKNLNFSKVCMHVHSVLHMQATVLVKSSEEMDTNKSQMGTCAAWESPFQL